MNRNFKKNVALMSALTTLMLAIGCGIVAGCSKKSPRYADCCEEIRAFS